MRSADREDAPFQTEHRGSYAIAIRSGAAEGLAVYDFGIVPRHRRLLVTKLDHVGDFLIALPALEKLRATFPKDHITLVCGSWNTELARASGVANEVRPYDFFPENAASWGGKPIEDVGRFREICGGPFDIALDLRVDEDTRYLLEHVDAALKCGIGSRVRHPFLNILLPSEFERRESDPPWLMLEPDRFRSRMPVRTPFFHETDFAVTNTHLVYGPFVELPRGSFRAWFGLQFTSALARLGGARISLDVTRGGGTETLATRRINWLRTGLPKPAAIDFVNTETGSAYEFRVHARGRPLAGRLRFFGVRVDHLDRGEVPRFKRADLHTGEQLSLLVQLLEERTRQLYPFRLSSIETGRASAVLGELPELPAGAKRIVLAPVSNSPTRDWGLGNYARLAAALLEREDCQIVLVGAREQRDRLAGIADANADDARIVNLAGRTDWFQTAQIIAECDLVISNNSGVAHLAAACGTATLAIYSGSHQPQEWGPRGGNVRALMAQVPCSPCGYERLELCPHDHLCMKQITPEIVAAEAIAMLAGAPQRHGPMPTTASDVLGGC